MWRTDVLNENSGVGNVKSLLLAVHVHQKSAENAYSQVALWVEQTVKPLVLPKLGWSLDCGLDLNLYQR